MASGHYKDNQYVNIPTFIRPTIDWLDIQLQDVQQILNRGRLSNILAFIESSFMPKVTTIPLSDKLKKPTIGTYDGTKELLDHHKNFKG